MFVIVKCWHPEYYDAATHAVIEFDLELVDNLLAKLALANRIKLEQESLGRFMGLEFDSYDPIFIDISVDDLETLGIGDSDLDEGFLILPANLEKYEWNKTRMLPVMQMVMAGDIPHPNGRVYWYGFDKHGDAGCRAETYSLYENDLLEIKKALTSTP